MSFDYDIFISYGHVDDEDPAGDVKGWVDLLVERLPGVVVGYLGYKPRIWRDERSLRGNDLLQGAIGEGVTRSLLLVPVVSPRYVLSDWCRRELETFCAAQAQAASVAGVAPFRSRIFKIVKTPLLLPHLRDREPEPLRDLIGYPFYEMDGDMPREFSADVVPAKDQRYWDALRRLAWDIANMLAALKQEPASQQPASTTTQAATPAPVVPASSAAQTAVAQTPDSSATAQDASSPAVASAPGATAASTKAAGPAANGAGESKTVYLAETTSDLARERDAVRDELRQRGHTVLPEQRLPLDSLGELAEAVRRDLARSCLSVHLVGARYGSTPEDDARSVARVQIELADERGAADPSFQRLLWMPPGLLTPALEVTDDRQSSFVAGLQARVTAGAELLQTSVEDLKTRVVEKLSAKPAAERGPSRARLKQVYLICENRDRSLIRPIREYLFKENFEVITWQDEGVAEKLMEYHRKNLRECDAALIFFGSGDEPWVRKNLEDLEKAYGYGREDDWSASAVYVGAPQSEQKEDFLTHMVPYVIRNFESFDPADLRDFVNAVRAAEGDRP
jgi:hypothetical protein